MNWIHEFDLFLFDFDGLLVNTEKLHYQAYQNMFRKRGYQLEWDFKKYLSIAHHSSEGLRISSYETFPKLQKEEPHWDVLYKEKSQEYIDLLHTGDLELMPGVEELLSELKTWSKRKVVVTHSQKHHVDAIRESCEPLSAIDEWITREDYENAKPASDCYQLAIDRYGKPGDRVVGFEDSPRGLTALMGVDAQAMFVTEFDYPQLEEFLTKGARHFKNFFELRVD